MIALVKFKTNFDMYVEIIRFLLQKKKLIYSMSNRTEYWGLLKMNYSTITNYNY